jgi:RecA/RadA recombinase
MANKWTKKLMELDGAVQRDYNPFAHVIRSPSPSVNFLFGNTWGLPRGYSGIIYGPPKGGKTLILNAFIGQLHRDDPEAIAVKFDTELREEGQLTPEVAANWGIDLDRLITYSVNTPDKIFDYISGPLRAMIDDGAPIKLIGIDSLFGIQGRRAMNQDTVMTQQIGDHAKTITDGLKQVVETIRHKRIALLATDQIRAEMDQLQQMRGKKVKMASAWAAQHFFEYFIFCEPFLNKDARKDLLGNEFLDKNKTDLMENSDKTGHKIRIRMEDSSVGPKNRVGIFTLDYNHGIINVHEEIYLLGVGRKVITNEKRGYYGFGGTEWHGEAAILGAIQGDMSGLGNDILKQCMLQDINGGTGPSTEESA